MNNTNRDVQSSRRDPRRLLDIPVFIPNPDYAPVEKPQPAPPPAPTPAVEPEPEPEWEIDEAPETTETPPAPEETEIEWELVEEPEPEPVPEEETPETYEENAPEAKKAGKKGIWIALIAIVAIAIIFGVVSLIGAIGGSGSNSTGNRGSEAVSWAQNDSFRTLAAGTSTPEPTVVPTDTPAPTEAPTNTPEPTATPTIETTQAVELITEAPTATPTAAPTAVVEVTQAPTESLSAGTAQGQTTKSKVNVRTEPTKDSNRVTTLPKEGTVVTVSGMTTNSAGETWYQIETSDGFSGYVQSEYLSVDNAASLAEIQAPITVTAEPITAAPVTAEPVTPEPITPEPVTQTPLTPEPVTVQPATVEPTVAPEANRFPFEAKTNIKKVNVRQEPSTDSKRVTTVINAGTTVTVSGEILDGQGALWYKVKTLDGYEGYMMAMYLDEILSDAAAESLTAGDNPSGNGEIYGLAIDKLATRDGPGTQYNGMGTYSVKGQYIKILSRAFDSRNGIWWVKCEIPYLQETRVLWTGYKRFDSSTLPLDIIPIE